MTDLYAGPLSLLSLLGINTVISLFNIKLFPNQAGENERKRKRGIDLAPRKLMVHADP